MKAEKRAVAVLWFLLSCLAVTASALDYWLQHHEWYEPIELDQSAIRRSRQKNWERLIDSNKHKVAHYASNNITLHEWACVNRPPTPCGMCEYEKSRNPTGKNGGQQDE